MPRTFSLILLTALALSIAAPAVAVPVTYQLQQGVENGFGFSGLHDADDSSPMSGASLGALNGTLRFDWDAGTNQFSFLSSTVSLDSSVYSFEIVGGQLDGASGGGFLEFVLTGSGAFAQQGQIVYAGGAPVCCGPDGPNRIDQNELRLWGASDIAPSGGVAGEPRRIGMDLGANAVPEPSAAAVFGLGLLVMRGAVRRNS